MTSAPASDRTAATPGTTLAFTAGVAVLWLIVALVRSGTTLHLGPFLVPLVPLFVARTEAFALWATGAAALMGLAVTAILWSTGNLNGPALGPFATATAESIAVLLAGTVAGIAGIAVSRRF